MTDTTLPTFPDRLDAATAGQLAAAVAARASADLIAAWRAAPGAPVVQPARTRVVAARSRLRTVPTTTVVRQGRDLLATAQRREAAVRTGLGLLSSARAAQGQGRAYAKAGRLRRTLSPQDRAALLDGHNPTPAQLEALDRVGVGPVASLDLNDRMIAAVEAQLMANLREAVRLAVLAEVTVIAAHERQRPTETVHLSELAVRTSELSDELQRGLARLYGQLRSTRVGEVQVAQEADLLAVCAGAAVRELGPFATGLQDWCTTGRARLRYRDDVAVAAVAVGTALRTALLALAVAGVVGVVLGAGPSPESTRWRQAARARPRGAFSALAGAPARGLTRVRGIVESIDDLQVGPTKRVAFVRVRRGPRNATTLVVPYFNPRYVGLRAGTSLDVRARRSGDVMAEFTNPTTRAAIAALTTRYGGADGAVLDRRDLAAEDDRSWLVWLVREIRPVYDAMPSSLNGTWSLGAWASIATSAATLS